MRALALSGGASKGAFTAGVVEYLIGRAPRRHNFDPHFDLAVGNSTGSLVGGPALLMDYDYCSNVYTSVENANIFRQSLIGRLFNFLGIVDGPIDASMKPLYQMVGEYYLSRGNLQKLIDSGKTFEVATVNVRTNLLHFVSSRQVAEGRIKPETFVRAIVASCCEPVFTQPIEIYKDEAGSPFKDDLFYDGGIREFIPIERAVVLGAKEVYAVSTGRLENTETIWGRGTPPDQVRTLDALGWTVSSLLDEVGRGDRFRADLYLRWAKAKAEIIRRARKAGIRPAEAKKLVDLPRKIDPGAGLSVPKLYLIYPHRPMHTSLEFDPNIMSGYLADGKLAARRFLELGGPLYTEDGTLREWLREQDLT
jgi:predicted acylesterase/phospholipase RssA